MFSANEFIQLRTYKRQVVEYVESTIPEETLELGVNVMAMQVSCKAPGCVPLETSIVIIFPKSKVELLKGLPESAGGSYKTKVLKPMAEVTKEDVLEALPPAFTGGKRSMERLCLQTRDVMLGQITQLFEIDDVEGRKLMAQYLQQSLQDYINRDCQPPEWGEDFTILEESITTNDVPAAPAEQEAKPVGSAFPKEGNVVIRRPIDENQDSSIAAIINSSETSNGSSMPSTLYQSHQNNQHPRPVASVNSITRLRHQQQAERRLMGGDSSSSTTSLLRLLARQHAPGVRRPGCACCEPDNPANIADNLMRI